MACSKKGYGLCGEVVDQEGRERIRMEDLLILGLHRQPRKPLSGRILFPSCLSLLQLYQTPNISYSFNVKIKRADAKIVLTFGNCELGNFPGINFI